MVQVVPIVRDLDTDQVRSSQLGDEPVDEGGSSLVAYGEMYMVTPAATGSITPGTPIKIAGTVAAGLTNLFSVTTTTGGRLTYTSATTRLFHVNGALTFTAGANTRTFGIYIAKNGTEETKTEIQRFTSTGTDYGAVALNGLFSLAQNDYLEVFVDITVGSATTMTVQNLNLMAIEV